jgi:hypothetical protein
VLLAPARRSEVDASDRQIGGAAQKTGNFRLAGTLACEENSDG